MTDMSCDFHRRDSLDPMLSQALALADRAQRNGSLGMATLMIGLVYACLDDAAPACGLRSRDLAS